MKFPGAHLLQRATLLLGGLLLWSSGVIAQNSVLPELPVSAVSSTRQFIVHGRDSVLTVPTEEMRFVGNDPVIQLRPDLLSVTCERVKRAVLDRLGQRDAWRGKVHLHLQRQPAIERPVAIRPKVYRDGWQFHLAVPERIEWPRLVRALTEVVLLEIANRDNTGTTCAQPPLWLAEGMNQLIVDEKGRDLVVESQTLMVRVNRKIDPLRGSRMVLKGRDPLEFSVLTLATPEQLTKPADFAFFQANAAVLVNLLGEEPRLPRLTEFLRALPQNLNWQTTFLAVNRAEFTTLLDVEKWWAVNAAHELAVDPELFWSPAEVRSRLGEILHESAAVRGTDGQPAGTENLPLSRIVTEWDLPAQQPVLQRKLSQLQVLLTRTPPEPVDLRQLVTEAFRTLDHYLAERTGAATEPGVRGDVGNRAKVLAKTAARRLDQISRQVAGTGR